MSLPPPMLANAPQDPEFRAWFEREMVTFQRYFQVCGKRGHEYKVRPRMVRRRGTVDRFPIWYVFHCDTTKEGTDRTLGRAELKGGPFICQEEADALVAQLMHSGLRTYYFGGRQFDLTPPKVQQAEADRRVDALRASVEEE